MPPVAPHHQVKTMEKPASLLGADITVGEPEHHIQHYSIIIAIKNTISTKLDILYKPFFQSNTEQLAFNSKYGNTLKQTWPVAFST